MKWIVGVALLLIAMLVGIVEAGSNRVLLIQSDWCG